MVATVVLSLAVRVVDLGTKSVFADELASFQFAHLDWHSFWQLVFHSEANMSLYYVLLRFWIHFGDSVPFLRFFSVIPAVATVPLIYVMGKDLFSPMVGLFASVLFSLNTFHIFYSQAGRGYSLAVFFVTLSCWFFVRSLREPAKANLVAYVLISAAALYSHFFAIFVLVAQCVSLLLWRPPRATFLRQCISMLAVGALASPLFVFALVHKTTPISWVEPTRGRDVYHFFTYLSGSGLKFALSLIALALAAKEYFRPRLRHAQVGTDWSFAFLAVWLLVPIITTLLISIWKPVFSPRFLMICLPAFVLLVARGLSLIRPAWTLYLVTAILIASCATALPRYYRQPGIEDWRSAIAYLHQHVAPADAILLNNPSFKDILEFSFHEFQTEPPTRNIISGPATEYLLKKSDRTWLIFCHANAYEEANTAALRARFDSPQTGQFIGIQIVEFKHTP